MIFRLSLLLLVLLVSCKGDNKWELDDQELIARALARKQLNAYNNRDIEAFMDCYCEAVQVYHFPNELIMNGQAEMRKRYDRMFEDTPDLNCLLLNRIVQGNTVIDQELVTRQKDTPPNNAIAIYKATDDCIKEVYFIRK